MNELCNCQAKAPKDPCPVHQKPQEVTEAKEPQVVTEVKEPQVKAKHPGGRPLKFKTPEELQKKIDSYFEMCQNNPEEMPTITGLAYHLDTSRKVLVEYEDNRLEYSNAIKKAKVKVEAEMEKRALTNKINPTITIFSLKNNFGWKDKTETDVTTKGQKIQPLIGGISVLPNHSDQSTPETPETN